MRCENEKISQVCGLIRFGTFSGLCPGAKIRKPALEQVIIQHYDRPRIENIACGGVWNHTAFGLRSVGK